MSTIHPVIEAIMEAKRIALSYRCMRAYKALDEAEKEAGWGLAESLENFPRKENES